MNKLVKQYTDSNSSCLETTVHKGGERLLNGN